MAGEVASILTMFLVMGLFMLAFFACLIALFVLWVFMLIDCAKRKFKNDNDRVLWILLLVFFGIIGAVIYYFVVKKPNKL